MEHALDPTYAARCGVNVDDLGGYPNEAALREAFTALNFAAVDEGEHRND
jgi:hypothetical protein